MIGYLGILESYGIRLKDEVEWLFFTFWKYAPGPTKVVVEPRGAIGSWSFWIFRDVIVYFGAF